LPRTSVFNPPPGIALGETDYSIPGQWAAGSNVRFVGRKAQPIGGWAVLNATPGITDYTVAMLEWVAKDGTRRLACANTGNLISLYGSALASTTALTPVGFVAGQANRWSLDLWGDHLIACWSGHKIYEWALGLGVPAAVVTNAPTTVTIALVNEERQLMAFGCNEELSGTFNPRCIRGSHTEDNTVWASLPSNLAFEYVLDGAGGAIRAAAKLPGKRIAVWTDDELFIGAFQPDPTNPHPFERVATGCGCFGNETVTVADGTVFWMTPDLRLMMWVPGTVPVPIPGVPEYYLTGGLSGFTASGTTLGFVWHNRQFDEVSFHASGSSASIPSSYLAVNIPSIAAGKPEWYAGNLNRSVMYQGINGCYGFDWFNLKLLQHETGKHGVPNSLLTWSISALVYMGEGEERIYLNRLIPDFESQTGNVTVTISTLDYPQGTETVKPPLIVAPGNTKKDFRASGHLFRIAIAGTDGVGATNTFARLGKLRFEHEPGGDR
jgi:hypothetical protein